MRAEVDMPTRCSPHDGHAFAKHDGQQPATRTRRLRSVGRLWKTFLARLPSAALAVTAFATVAATSAAAQTAGGESGSAAHAPLPLFRHIDAALVKTRPPRPAQIRYLLSDALPPFSYRNRNGALTGYAVAVAQAVCRRARVRCQFIVRPFDKLVDELLQGRGDVILGGVRPTPQMWEKLDFTRPYFKALGRFAVARDARITRATLHDLTGRRVVAVKGSVHALWLARHMRSVRLVLKPDLASAAAELRDGGADALFGDWLQLAFWVRGTDAAGCCRLLDEPLATELFAYNHLSMAVAPTARTLRDFLDRQLDLLQEDGELRILARRFLPLGGDAGNDGQTGKARQAGANGATTARQPQDDRKADGE